jgi:hypothetical protein
MNFDDWLKLARNEQANSTDADGSHLYANYRHTTRDALIRKSALNKFIRNLPKVTSGPGLPAEDLAGRLVYNVAVSQYQRKPSRGHVRDFRLMGKNIKCGASEHFVNISQKLAPYPTVTGLGGMIPFVPTAPGPLTHPPGSLSSTPVAHAIKPAGVIWLCPLNRILGMIELIRPATQDELFVNLSDWLGLKPTGRPWRDAKTAPWAITATLRLYRTHDDSKLRRPHALSGGYSDRFCGATIFTPYGSTAQCSTGAASLPEAITQQSELVEVVPTEPEYDTLCQALAAINGAFVSNRLPGQALIGQITSDQFPPHGGYLPLQQAIIARL